MDARVTCSQCGKWMFHLAKTCPHCGAAQGEPVPEAPAAKPAPPPKKLELTPEEARSLLSTVAPREPRMKDMAADLVLPRAGVVDLTLTLAAVPVTVLTVVVLGYGVLQAMRKRLPLDLRAARLLAVPTSAALAAVLLHENDARREWWAALGLSLLSWFVRDLLRAQARKSPLD